MVTGSARGRWRCRFRDGQLVDCQPASTATHDPSREAFTYTVNLNAFWRAAAGRLDPQRAFLDDDARVEGDIEAALKMAMVLHRFNREFPCTPLGLLAEAGLKTSPAPSNTHRSEVPLCPTA